MFNLFKKNQEEISRTTPGYEETERRTPKTGIILLILMFIAGIYFGLYAMDDLSNIPDRPKALSSCSYRYQTNTAGERPYENKLPTYYEEDLVRSLAYEDSNNCAIRLSPLEEAGGVAALYQRRITIEQQIDPVVTEYIQLDNNLQSIRSQIERATGEYGVGLQEKQADLQAFVHKPWLTDYHNHSKLIIGRSFRQNIQTILL